MSKERPLMTFDEILAEMAAELDVSLNKINIYLADLEYFVSIEKYGVELEDWK